MVIVAQLVERQIVALEVRGSSPLGHPRTVIAPRSGMIVQTERL